MLSGVGSLVPSSAMLPTGQRRQRTCGVSVVAWSARPVLGLYWPAGHFWHSFQPPAENVPAGLQAGRRREVRCVNN